ncbi:hypothetical protein PROFUN_11868 [Planoprotostelium fungivorum]|uniref:Uncharacterized protein n=1 Tax=Planoprotostelium fungivorum TaxID=1890364 RepID=A0A2P6N9D0_9EUKA|nr:hypothetical protein PROFUN_11868 [Planoprotostelium fungivorum]
MVNAISSQSLPWYTGRSLYSGLMEHLSPLHLGQQHEGGDMSNRIIPMKLVVLGEGGVGKSALSCQFIRNHFISEYDPTIENSFREQKTIDGQAYMLEIVDTAGQDEYNAMRDRYIRLGEGARFRLYLFLTSLGFVLVYSITSRVSFEKLDAFHSSIQRVREDDVYPVVLVANKSDLEADREVTTSEGISYSKKVKAAFFETSAKLRMNVDESFMQLVREVVKMKSTEGASEHTEPDTPKSTNPEKKGCCIIV